MNSLREMMKSLRYVQIAPDQAKDRMMGLCAAFVMVVELNERRFKMSDKLYPEYGNAGHKFPRTTQEAFGPGAAVFVATSYDEDCEYLTEFESFSFYFALVVYTLAAIVIGVILWGPK